jgi:hypothetical protein
MQFFSYSKADCNQYEDKFFNGTILYSIGVQRLTCNHYEMADGSVLTNLWKTVHLKFNIVGVSIVDCTTVPWRITEQLGLILLYMFWLMRK